MISEAEGNLLDADVDALVNTVNTVGAMGKGIALQFRRAYPDMFKAYSRAVKDGEVRLGLMHVWPTAQLKGPRYVVNFPTKGHWRARSRLSDVREGLDDLVRVVRELGIRSIAVPPLGCGNGGLDWRDVAPLIADAFAALPEVDVRVYPPKGAPAAREMPTRTSRPKMTLGKAALIDLVDRYRQRALEVSLIEVQKLMYFLQEAGEPLKLEYTKNLYGPYADNLRKSLRSMEGHFLTGFGDGSKPVHSAEPIEPLPGAAEEARAVLEEHPQTVERIDHVLALVDGFESAYALELLATVHWVTTREDPRAASDVAVAAELIRRWSERKERMFGADHVAIAWDRLRDAGWLTGDRVPA